MIRELCERSVNVVTGRRGRQGWGEGGGMYGRVIDTKRYTDINKQRLLMVDVQTTKDRQELLLKMYICINCTEDLMHCPGTNSKIPSCRASSTGTIRTLSK